MIIHGNSSSVPGGLRARFALNACSFCPTHFGCICLHITAFRLVPCAFFYFAFRFVFICDSFDAYAMRCIHRHLCIRRQDHLTRRMRSGTAQCRPNAPRIAPSTLYMYRPVLTLSRAVTTHLLLHIPNPRVDDGRRRATGAAGRGANHRVPSYTHDRLIANASVEVSRHS